MITIEYDPDYVLEQLEKYHDRYNNWDQNFLLDISYVIRQGRGLSPRQRAHLDQLMHKAKFWNKFT